MLFRHDFIETMDKVITSSQPSNGALALLVVRFKELKEIITFFGFEVGDEYIRHIGEKLDLIMRSEDVIARIGDSEFGILLPNLHNPSHAILAVNKITNAFKEPFVCDDVTVDVHASIGVVIPKQRTKNTALLQNAYQALLQAEKKRASFALYELSATDSLPPNLVVEREIVNALNNDEFKLYYQPKYVLSSKESYSAEALIRWMSPKLGAVNTQYFIDVLEKSDLLMVVTKWIVNRALSQLAECQKKIKNYKIAVNLSPALFINDDIVDLILSAVSIWGVDPSTLILEVTENAMMENPEMSLDILGTIHAAGIEISIDDFGTGYSSLGYLRDLPANELKIDMSFVKNMHESPRNRSIATSTVQLAHNLGLKVTAEGIENEEVVNLLIAMGCDLGQGYHLARPMPFEDLLKRF